MKVHRLPKLLVFAVFALSVSCIPQEVVRVRVAPVTEQDEQFDPLSVDQNEEIRLEPKAEAGALEVQAGQGPPAEVAVPDSLREAAQAAGYMQGYRVQLFAGAELERAKRVEAEAKQLFEENVYVEYVAPYYKVRIGDYATHAEAEQLADKARGLGYEGAWVVRTLIKRAQ